MADENEYERAIPWPDLREYLQRRRLKLLAEAEDALSDEREGILAQTKLLRDLLNLPETLKLQKKGVE